jgi:predicted Zn-dependent protease
MPNPILLQYDRAVHSNAPATAAVMRGIAAVHAILPRDIRAINYRPLIAGQGLEVDQHLDNGSLGPNRVEHDSVQQSRKTDRWRAESSFAYTDLLITARDLVVGSWTSVVPYVLGFAGSGVAMVSVYRMAREATSLAAGLKVIELVVAHELVHSYGLVPDSAARMDRRGGIYHNHCTNPGCAMRQFGTVREGEALLRTMGGRVLFCADCTRDLNSLRGQTFAAGRKTYGVTFRR